MSVSIVLKNYKGYKCLYSEQRNVFIVEIDDSTHEESSLAKLKKWIDNLEKKEFERVDVFVSEYWGRGKYTPAVVTSLDDDYAWISRKKDKKRSKESINNLVLDTNLNRKRIEEIKTLYLEIGMIEEKIEAIKKALEKYEP